MDSNIVKGFSCALLLSLLVALGCQKPKVTPATNEKPAKLEPHPTEQDIYRIKLTEKAQERLQISTAPAQMQSVPRSRRLGGDVIVPDGMRIPVMAPLPGKLSIADGQNGLVAGQKVKTNQPLLQLTPILRPDLEVPGVAERVQMANARAALITAQIQAQGDFEQSKATVEGAKIALDRSRQLLSDRAGSRRAVDEFEAAYNVAQRGLEAAKQRKELLDKLTLEAESGEAPTVIITAPRDGIVQTITSSIDQVVSAGSPLFEIVDLSELWVRVPIYAGQVHEFDLEKSASLLSLAGQSAAIALQRINAPPTANALASSVDVYFKLANSGGEFLPGQRVMVDLPMIGEQESLVVPRAAVVYDIHGIGWVYIKSGERQYERARVAVQFTTDEFAVLRSGPAAGTQVVVDGAAELFGTEFGAGK
jgi:membrane fusion protein, heavy metal efflux system